MFVSDSDEATAKAVLGAIQAGSGFSFGSAAEVLDEDAGEEGDGIEVGFGFGDSYDFGTPAG